MQSHFTSTQLVQPTISILTNDLLLCICIFLDIETVFKMKFTSKEMEERLSAIIVNLRVCDKLRVLKLTQRQITDISKDRNGYKKIKLISSKVFEETLISPYPYYTKHSSFFKNRPERIKFKLKDLQPLILTDKASQLFSKVSILSRIITFIEEDNFNLDTIKQILKGSWVSDSILCFIGLLPNIVKYNATKSFDLFVKAYLAIHVHYMQKIKASEYNHHAAFNLVFYEYNNYYTNRFIELVIKYYPVDKNATLYNFIELACNDNRKVVVYDCLKSVSHERRIAIIDRWRTLDQYSYLFKELYMHEVYRDNIIQTLNKAQTIISSTPNLNLIEVKKLKKHLNAAFAEIATLEEQMKNTEDNLYSNTLQIYSRR